LPVLDRFSGAEVNAGATEFAVVFPDRFFVHHPDIVYRAYRCTRTTGRTFLIGHEILVSIMERADEPVIGQVF
jgi:hypothetical protein